MEGTGTISGVTRIQFLGGGALGGAPLLLGA